jgi:biotin operon repressor
MTQAERDRLVALKKAKKKLITQKEAAAEIGITERQVRRLLRALKRRGDQAVIHALRGQTSNRKIEDSEREKAIKILWEFRLSSDCKDLRGVRREAAYSGRSAEAVACGSKEFESPPFPFPPPGESRGGRVPPTPPKPGGSPHKRGFKALR